MMRDLITPSRQQLLFVVRRIATESLSVPVTSNELQDQRFHERPRPKRVIAGSSNDCYYLMLQQLCRRESETPFPTQIASLERLVIHDLRGNVAGAVAYCNSGHGSQLQNAMMRFGFPKPGGKVKISRTANPPDCATSLKEINLSRGFLVFFARTFRARPF